MPDGAPLGKYWEWLPIRFSYDELSKCTVYTHVNPVLHFCTLHDAVALAQFVHVFILTNGANTICSYFWLSRSVVPAPQINAVISCSVYVSNHKHFTRNRNEQDNYGAYISEHHLLLRQVMLGIVLSPWLCFLLFSWRHV